MKLWESYRMRWRRKRARLRATLRFRQLSGLNVQTRMIRPGGVLLFSVVRNEVVRLPWFLKYYRDLGVDHFLIVDNDSTDGTTDLLRAQPDVSLWHTTASYKAARYGVDWLNALQRRHGVGHWCLTVDPDELFVYPFCDTRPIAALTDWLDASGIRSFGAMMLDMYPKGRINATRYEPGQDPIEIASWFDPGNYSIKRNPALRNLWIQGGPRARVFFADRPNKAPALNKVPLVKWERGFAYVSSTHMILPRGLNLVYDEWGGEKASGVLLHAKFLNTMTEKAVEEAARGEHYAGAGEYRTYAETLTRNPDLWCKWSEKYINWRQLEILGLMSKGNWA